MKSPVIHSSPPTRVRLVPVLLMLGWMAALLARSAQGADNWTDISSPLLARLIPSAPQQREFIGIVWPAPGLWVAAQHHHQAACKALLVTGGEEGCNHHCEHDRRGVKTLRYVC